MTITYWIKENGNGAYCEGIIPDGAYDTNTCILVAKKPSIFHKWNNVLKQWEISIENKRNMIRPIRNCELDRTDKFVMQDFFASFTEQEQSLIIQYRQSLRNLPENQTLGSLDMPVCPEFMI